MVLGWRCCNVEDAICYVDVSSGIQKAEGVAGDINVFLSELQERCC